MKSSLSSLPEVSISRVTGHLSRIALAFAGVFLFGAAASAQTLYTLSASGNWGNSTIWSPVGVPNNIGNTTVTIGSSRTATVDGAYSTGYAFVGAGSSLNITGSGNSLALGNLGSSSISAQISGNATVSSGGGLTSTNLILVNAGGRLTVENASVSLNSFRVSGTVTLNEGAALSGFVGSSGGGVGSSLVFNGGASGFGELTTTTFDATRAGTLSINSGTFAGIGSFTLIDATSWGATAFSAVLFNSNSYTLGQDVVLGDKTWNVSKSGNDLLLNVTAIPEPGTFALLLGAVALGIAGKRVRRSKAGLSADKTA